MPATQSAPSINDIIEAGKQAKENPIVQRLIDDVELRENAISALQSARRAFDRASKKNWDKKKLATDKRLREDLHDALASLRQTRESFAAPAPEKQAKKKRHPLRKLILIAIVGAIIALVVSPDARKVVLDTLFGAEEEFEYKSTTTTPTSANGAA